MVNTKQHRNKGKKINRITSKKYVAKKLGMTGINRSKKNKKGGMLDSKTSKTSCTKRNPSPPCNNGFIIKKNKKGEDCCYKDSKTSKTSCSKRNPSPPCNNGFIIKKNKKGEDCCYKDSKTSKGNNIIKKTTCISKRNPSSL